MITEFSHPWIKKIHQLEKRTQRGEKRMFVGEGNRLLLEAMGALSGNHLLEAIHFVIFENDWKKREENKDILQALESSQIQSESVSEKIFRGIAQTESPQGVLFVGRLKGESFENWAPPRGSFWLVADAIQDPGNLGTMIRSAFASGCNGIVATRGTVDLYNSKVIRGSAGAAFYLPYFGEVPHTHVIERAHKAGLSVYATSPAGGSSWDEVSWEKGGVVVIGNEGAGVQPVWEKNNAARVHIPLRKGAESLNAAMAATLICFSAARKAKWI